MEENYAIALKCVFHEPKGELRGAFCIVVRKHDEKVVEFILWTTKLRSKFELSVFLSWEDFTTQIPEIGQLEKESCDKLKKIISDKLDSEGKAPLLSGTDEEIKAFVSSIKGSFEDTLHYEVSVDTELETFERDRLVNSGYERETTDESSDDDVKMSDIVIDGIDTSQAIACTPKIDPVNGIAASALKPGDLLEVTVSTNTPAGKLIAEYYAQMGEEPLLPVENVTATGLGSYLILLKVGNGMTCVVRTTTDIKMKGKRLSETTDENPQRNMLVVGMFALVFILGLIAIIIKILR